MREDILDEVEKSESPNRIAVLHGIIQLLLSIYVFIKGVDSILSVDYSNSIRLVFSIGFILLSIYMVFIGVKVCAQKLKPIQGYFGMIIILILREIIINL